RIIALLAIDHIMEVTTGLIPKALVERLVNACRKFAVLMSIRFAQFFANPYFHQTKRVVPERIDLHGFSAAGCDHPVAHFGIHPSKLVAFFTLAQQSIRRIDTDSKAYAANMVLDDVDELRQQLYQRVTIIRY